MCTHFCGSRTKVLRPDLKLDNILLTLEHQSIIEAFVEGQAIHPMARKRVDNRTVYRCHNDFGRINGDDALKKMYPKITDFGLAQRGDQPGPFLYPIQPNDCHAPEVLLGTGWSYSADIWNFGVMVSDSSVFLLFYLALLIPYLFRCGISSGARGYSSRRTRTLTLQYNI